MTMNAHDFTQAVRSTFIGLFMPQTHFIETLKKADMQFPFDLFKRPSRSIPYYEMRSMIGQCLNENSGHPFDEPFIEKKSRFEVSYLTDMHGCTSSKSSCGDYEEMDVDVPSSAEEAEALAKSAFHSELDGIAPRGRNASVLRQVWDKKQWFANNDGSHRSAGVWHYDTQNDIKRPIDCDVMDVDVNPELKIFAYRYSIWIFESDKMDTVNDVHGQINESMSRDKHESLNHVRIARLEGKYSALIVPRQSQMHYALSDTMESCAFDLSDWITEPHKFIFDKDNFLKPKIQSQEPDAVRSNLKAVVHL
jgi:hypothetical protein